MVRTVQPTIMRCEKWVLRATKVRRERENYGNTNSISKRIKKTSLSKTNHVPPSPTSSAHSVVGENSAKVHTMNKGKKIEAYSWSYVNTQIFIEVMLEEAQKEQGSNSRKTKVFNLLQWNEIHRQLVMRTGKTNYTLVKIQQKFDRLKKELKFFKDLINSTGFGWNLATQTVVGSEDQWRTYIQACPEAAKFINKGLDHYDLLDELCHGSLATGSFARPSTLGAPTSDDETTMNERGKAIKMEYSGKRKSDGTSGSSVKAAKFETQQNAYSQFAYANQMKGEYYGSLANKLASQCLQQEDEKPHSVEACVRLLKELKPFIDDKARYMKAYNIFVNDDGQRRGFVLLDG